VLRGGAARPSAGRWLEGDARCSGDGDVDGARRYVRGHHPAVLVLDLNMHGDSSLEAIPVIRGESPDTQIVV
jgi:DNA-binding NarL/FixJ family response regulator